MKRLSVIAVGLLIAGGCWYVYLQVERPAKTIYRTTEIKRGNVSVSISATGTIEPEEVVDVGAQVGGRIASLGRDTIDESHTIDYCSLVDEGTVLALIDPELYASQVEQAKANVLRAKAEIMQAEANLDQASRAWKRAQLIYESKSIAEAEYEQDRANDANARATLELSKATLAQSNAIYEQAMINMSYTTIKSPVRGVIIDRRVNVGQTVVSSLSAPSLFLIAKDLKRLQVWASVNEADIGQIHLGQHVHFTVDAYPYDTFDGQVSQIRLNATMTQNVVTYTVVVSTENSGGKLLPYMTANAKFEIAKKENILTVLNSALKWKPQTASISLQKNGEENRSESRQGVLWIKDSEGLRPVSVQVGLSDGVNTEVSGGECKEALNIVVGQVIRAPDTSGSPFTPKIFGNNPNTKG